MRKVNITLYVLIICYIFICVFPNIYYKHKLEYKNFIVYYSDKKIEQKKNLTLILDDAIRYLKKSEIYDEKFKQKIILTDTYNEYTFFAQFLGKSFGVNSPLSQNVFITKSDISKNMVIKNDKENNKRTLTSIIVHETMHSLIQNKVGYFNYYIFSRNSTWKNEGYSKFIADESSFDEKKGLEYLCHKSPDIESDSFKYFKYRYYVKYLFEDDKIKFNEFLNRDFNLNHLDEKLKRKYCKK